MQQFRLSAPVQLICSECLGKLAHAWPFAFQEFSVKQTNDRWPLLA